MDREINNTNKLSNTDKKAGYEWITKSNQPKRVPSTNEKGIAPHKFVHKECNRINGTKPKKNAKKSKNSKQGTPFNPNTGQILRELNGEESSQSNYVIENKRLTALDNGVTDCSIDSSSSSSSYRTAKEYSNDMSSDYSDAESVNLNIPSRLPKYMDVDDDDFVFQQREQ